MPFCFDFRFFALFSVRLAVWRWADSFPAAGKSPTKYQKDQRIDAQGKNRTNERTNGPARCKCVRQETSKARRGGGGGEDIDNKTDTP